MNPLQLFTYLCMLLGALVTEAADRLIPEYPAAPTPVPTTYRMLGYNPVTSNYYTIPAGDFIRATDTNNALTEGEADVKYYPLNGNPGGYTDEAKATLVAQYVLAGWMLGGSHTNTVDMSTIPVAGSPAAPRNENFNIETSAAPYSVSNSAMLGPEVNAYGIISCNLSVSNISSCVTYITIQGPTNGSPFYAYLASMDQCGEDNIIGTSHQVTRSILINTNTLNVYIFTNTFADSLRPKRMWIWLGGPTGTIAIANKVWITSWKISYYIPNTMPAVQATLSPSIDWLNHSNLVVAFDGDSRTDEGDYRVQLSWPRTMEGLSWMSNRFLWTTNVGISSGVLNGTTNWMRGDPNPGSLPAGSFGCIQRYPRWGPALSASFPDAEKWILLMLPINDGFPSGYATNVTNYCNMAHADGWRVAVITSYPATAWADQADMARRNHAIARMYPVYDKLIDLADLWRTAADSVMLSDGIHAAALGTQIIAGIINSRMQDPAPMPWVHNPTWASPTTTAPTNSSAIAAWEDAIAVDGSTYKRPLYR